MNLVTGDGVDVAATLNGIDLRPGIEVFVFDPDGRLAGHVESGTDGYEMPSARHPTYITDAISWVWDKVSAPFSPESERRPPPSVEEQVRALVTPRVGPDTVFLPFHFSGRWMGEDMLKYYPEGAAPIVRGEAVNTATTYGYDVVTMMQETKSTVCQVMKA